MAKLIVKNRRLCVVDRRLVTDGNGAPCLCGGGGLVECQNLTQLPGVCFTLEFSGIEPNPVPYTVTSGIPPQSTTYTTQTLVGVNRTVRVHSFQANINAFPEEPGVLVLSWTGANPGLPNPFSAADEFEFSIFYECIGEQVFIRVVNIGIASGFPPSVFEWLGNEPLTNGMVLPNQIAGQDATFMRHGQGGSVRITAEVLSQSECQPGTLPSYLAILCGGSERIPVDISDRPPGAFGIIYNGQNYQLTSLQSALPPVPVVWTQEVCPPPPGEDFYLAIRCRNTGSATEDPATVVYAVNDLVGAGNGRVFRTTITDNPTCPGDAFCVRRTEYTPTATPASGPATARVSHVQGTACAAADSFTCQACPSEPVDPDDGPTPRPRGFADDDMLDAMGFDPEEERRKLQQGGDCGCSAYTYGG